ncbi:MAG: YibE/F family protein [Patescibacteria group bacterium]
MKKIITYLLTAILFFTATTAVVAQEESSAPEQTPQQEVIQKPSEFYLGRVSQVVSDENTDLGGGVTQPVQKVKIKIVAGAENGKEIEIDHGSLFSITEEQKVKQGELVVITKAFQSDSELYYIADKFRIGIIAVVLVLVIAIWAILGRGRNMGMLISLIGSLVIAYKYLVPRLIVTPDALPAIILTTLFILGLLIYIGYGVSRRNSIILISSLVTALLGFGLTYLLIKLTGLTGSGGEEAIFLQTGAVDALGLKNLLMAGITVGTLGIIALVSKKQIDIVELTQLENKKLNMKQLLAKILINPTNSISGYISVVFLTILGTVLPLIMLFGINQTVPFWVTLNSEFIMGEVIRLIATVATVVLAVPVTSVVAVNLLTSEKKK